MLQRSLGNQVMQRLSDSRAVIQLQTDPTPPANILEQRRKEQNEELVEGIGTGQEIEDAGEGVASIEAGTPPQSFGESEEEGEERLEPSPVQTKPANQPVSEHEVISPNAVLRSLDGGFPMDDHLKENMENVFGERFSGVKFYTNQRANTLAASLGAQAFTIGNHIAFAGGRYQPGTNEGQKLIAHELTHVVQQRRGLSNELLPGGIGRPGDKFEMEADRMAEQIGRQENTRSGVSPLVTSDPARESQGQGIYRKNVIQLFSGSAAATYARTWATGTNPAYGRFGNDCTNFASQAMEAGGWTMLTGSGYCADRTKDSVWWFTPGGCTYTACPWSWCPTVKSINASYTWGGAHNFSNFVRASGRGTHASTVWDLNVGDVLQMDFSGGGHIGHTMVATQKTGTNLFFSYHTSDHLDEPFWPDGTNPGILARNPDPPTKYWGWKM